MIKVSEEELQSPFCISFDGGNSHYACKTVVTRVDDWHETPLGRINFGYVQITNSGLVRCTLEKDHDPQKDTETR